ncbi:MAG: hypothetical protein NWF10_02800 [Candidatus Bathyarchaeota archaeon]|nr:hypothetical protein [Candidatus Bathyarchaeota archaeon]
MASPRIKRSDILLGLVVLVAVIMSVALFLGQLPGFTDNPNGPNLSSLQIIDLATNAESGTLIAYVENIRSETFTIDSGFSITVNDIEIPLFKGSVDKDVLEQGQIATIDIPFKITPGIPLVVRILKNDVVLAERTVSDPDTLLRAYTLRVNIQGDSANKITKIPDQASYPSGTSVSLTAEAVEGWVFSEWSGDVAGSSNPISLVIDGDKTANAMFIEGDIPPSPTPTPKPTPTPDQTVDVTFVQSGLDSSATGTVLTVQGTSKSYSDFPFTIIVNKGSFLNYDFSDLVESGDSGKQFVLASVTGPDSPISGTSDVTVRANFKTQYEVTFSSNPETADASTQPEGVQWFDSGQKVAISTDTSSSRYVFFQWETSNLDNQIENVNSQSTNVTINGSGSITAVYSLVRLQVSFAQNGIDNPAIETTVTYSINGGSAIESAVPFDVTVDYDSTIEYSYEQTIIVSAFAERYQLADTSPSSPITITGNIEIVGNYDLQYFVIFDEIGLDNSAEGTVLTIDGEAKNYNDLPIVSWFDRGSTYRYSATVSGGANKRFILVSPIGHRTINSPDSVDGNYEVQYFFEVISPIGSPTGEGWYYEGDTVFSNSGSPIPPSGSPEIGYTATGYTGTGSVSNGDGTTVEFTIDSPSTVTWLWRGVMKLFPDGIVEQNIPYSVGSDDHVECVTDQVNPDSKYIYHNNRTQLIDYYSLQDVGSISGTIERVTVYAQCKSLVQQGDGRIYMRLGGTQARGSEFSLSVAWTDYSYSRTSRPGGGSWTWNNINNLQVGIQLQSNFELFEEAACTLVWAEIEFTV